MSKIYRPVIPIWIEEEDMRLIDADAYKSRMGGVYGEYWEEVLDDMPTIDAVEVVRGEWIRIENPRYEYDRQNGMINEGVSYRCSVCTGIGHFADNYCSHCGAKMDGGE